MERVIPIFTHGVDGVVRLNPGHNGKGDSGAIKTNEGVSVS